MAGVPPETACPLPGPAWGCAAAFDWWEGENWRDCRRSRRDAAVYDAGAGEAVLDDPEERRGCRSGTAAGAKLCGCAAGDAGAPVPAAPDCRDCEVRDRRPEDGANAGGADSACWEGRASDDDGSMPEACAAFPARLARRRCADGMKLGGVDGVAPPLPSTMLIYPSLGHALHNTHATVAHATGSGLVGRAFLCRNGTYRVVREIAAAPTGMGAGRRRNVPHIRAKASD